MKALVRTVRTATRRLYAATLLRPHLRAATWLRAGRKHVARIDPFENLWVDPATIETCLDQDREEYMAMRDAFGVRGGDWDLRAKPLEQHFVYHSFVEHFERGVPWEHTPLFERAAAGIGSGTWHYHGCRSTADVLSRLQSIDALYDRIRREGYKAQSALADGGSDEGLRRRRTRPPELDEIIVNVDRDGALVFVDGVHRFSAARLIGVPLVPVCVLIRHSAWQAYRDRVARAPTDFPAEALEHPDLAYLLPRRRSSTAS